MSSLPFDLYVDFMLSQVAGQGEDLPCPNENSPCSFYPPYWWQCMEDKGQVNTEKDHILRIP